MSEKLTVLPYGLNGTVYRSPLPYSWLFDPQHTLFDAYLSKGVTTVVMLTPISETIELTGRDMRAYYLSYGMDVIYVPVIDFSVPDKGVFEDAIPQALSAVDSGQTVVIHCHAGIGRTGMFSACLAKTVFDMSGREAIAWIRRFIPDAVETHHQAAYVRYFRLPEHWDEISD